MILQIFAAVPPHTGFGITRILHTRYRDEVARYFSWASHGTTGHSVLNGFPRLTCPKKDEPFNIDEPCCFNFTWSLSRAGKFMSLLVRESRTLLGGPDPNSTVPVLFLTHESKIIPLLDSGMIKLKQQNELPLPDGVVRTFEPNFPVEMHFTDRANVIRDVAIIGEQRDGQVDRVDRIELARKIQTVLPNTKIIVLHGEPNKLCLSSSTNKNNTKEFGFGRNEFLISRIMSQVYPKYSTSSNDIETVTLDERWFWSDLEEWHDELEQWHKQQPSSALFERLRPFEHFAIPRQV